MRIAVRSRAAVAFLILLSQAAAGDPAGTPAAATDATPPANPFPCEKPPEFHQFDFWVGEWDVIAQDKVAGRNRVSVREHGCVLVEEWRGASGSTGMSMNYYDPARAKWVQLWISADGTLIEISGGPRDGKMVLEGEIYYYANERRAAFRGIWTPLPDGRLQQVFEESPDGGKTWTTWFDGTYRRATAQP